MARNLHDSVSQTIHSLILFTATLSTTIEKGNFELPLDFLEQLFYS